MLDYGWGPSSMMLSSADQTPEPPAGQLHFDQNFSAGFINHQHHQGSTHYAATQQPFLHFAGFYDGASAYPDPQLPAGFTMQVPKAEPVLEFNSRIGLNLGGRTYFASSSEDDFVNRLYRRSRMFDPDVVPLSNSPRCQAEGCAADLTHAKHYHRRHKVCEFHSKAATVVAAGVAQRFCQQCSRFHLLSEFDNGKRSCRKRLDDHNRRRRKSNQTTNNNKNQETSCNDDKSQLQPRSPPDSGPHSSSVTVAISPPRVTMDRFRHGSYAPTSSSTASTGYTMY